MHTHSYLPPEHDTALTYLARCANAAEAASLALAAHARRYSRSRVTRDAAEDQSLRYMRLSMDVYTLSEYARGVMGAACYGNECVDALFTRVSRLADYHGAPLVGLYATGEYATGE